MNSWTHETKAAAFGQLITEASTHSSEFFKPMRDGGYSKLRKDVFQQHQELTAHHDPKDLSDYAHVYRKLRPYTTNSKKLNLSLINKPKSLSHAILHANTAKNISGIIEKHGKPLESDVHVYSGTGKFNPGQHLREGGILHTPAFTSTSLNPSTAHEFLQHDEAREAHVIHFHLPKGYNKGYYVGSKSMVQHEHEMILDKGQKWKLTGHEEVQNHNGDVGKVRKLHIWSVTPHDEHIKESTYHNPHMFRELHVDSKIITADYDTKIIKQKNSPRVKNIQNHVKKDVKSQHEYLSEHHFPKEQLHAMPYDHPIRAYTQGSFHLNYRVLHKEGGGYDSESISKEHAKIPTESHTHLDDLSHNLSSDIAKYGKPLEHETHVYSGVNFDMHKVAAQSNTVHLPTFTSTTIDPVRSKGFATFKVKRANTMMLGHDQVEEKHILHFKLPKGYKKGVYVSPVSSFADEHEFLLDKGQKWKITGHKRVNDFVSSKTHYEEGDVPSFKGKTIVHNHIWTLEPHDENIHEMTYHDHGEIFGDLHKIETKYLDYNHESLSMHKDMVAQHLRLRDHFQGSVTKEQGHAIASYSDESYGLNKSLIKGTKLGENDQKIHDHLNTAFANTKGLPEDVHAYSGLKDLNPEEHFKKSNGVIHLPAHTSASINPQIAHTFTNDHNAKHEDGSHIIHFHLPAGHKHSIYIHSHTYMPQEHEIVIQHGHKWKLTDYDTHTKQVYNFGTGKVEPKTVHVWSVKPHEEDTPK